MKFVKNFLDMIRDESGAVTVEYVALAVVVIGLGTTAYTAIGTEVSTKAATIW